MKAVGMVEWRLMSGFTLRRNEADESSTLLNMHRMHVSDPVRSTGVED